MTVTIKKLSGVDLEVAQAAHAAGVFDGWNGRGWAANLARKIIANTATEAEVKRFAADPLSGYDRATILRCRRPDGTDGGGLVSWSYTEQQTGKAPQMKPITVAAVADINEDDFEFFAVEIMKLTKPELFLPKDPATGKVDSQALEQHREAEQKNG